MFTFDIWTTFCQTLFTMFSIFNLSVVVCACVGIAPPIFEHTLVSPFVFRIFTAFCCSPAHFSIFSPGSGRETWERTDTQQNLIQKLEQGREERRGIYKESGRERFFILEITAPTICLL